MREGLLPADRLEFARAAFGPGLAPQRPRQPRRGVLLHDPRGALGADHALVQRVVGVAVDVAYLAVAQVHADAAAAGAHVARGLAHLGMRSRALHLRGGISSLRGHDLPDFDGTHLGSPSPRRGIPHPDPRDCPELDGGGAVEPVQHQHQAQSRHDEEYRPEQPEDQRHGEEEGAHAGGEVAAGDIQAVGYALRGELGWLQGPGTFTMKTTWLASRIAIAKAKNATMKSASRHITLKTHSSAVLDP